MRTFVIIVLGLLGACRNDAQQIAAEPAISVPATKPLEPPPKNVNELDAQRDALMRTIDERAAAFDAKLNALEKRPDEKAKKAVALLRAKRDQALARLAELDQIPQDRWSIYERDVTTVWDQLESDATDATR